MTAEDARSFGRWLALREPADAEARARGLVERLGPSDRWVIHDLGGGTGAMGRWLAPLLSGSQHWIAHDRDADLLAVAGDAPGLSADGSAVRVETRRSDITRLTARDFASATLITASALLDMLTEDELRRIVMGCSSAGCPVLLTLTVVGRVALSPAEPLDGRIAAAFNAHQRRVSERGRLLGPHAATFAVEQFRRLGAAVLVRDSPWRLDASHRDLLEAWFTGWVRAGCEQQSELAVESEGYMPRRLAQARTGALAVTVGHTDLLALPG
jgi:hypothetical protein